MPEDAPLEPRSTYAATKLAQEHLAGAWARQCGGEVWALRYHNVYGPGCRATPRTPASPRSSGPPWPPARAPRVIEDGRQTRDFVHVTDVARANVLALTGSAPDGRLHGGQRLLRARRTRSATSPTRSRRRWTARARSWSVAPGRPTCGTWSRRRCCAAETLGFRAEVDFADGVAAFAHDEQREPAAVTI